MHKRSGNQEALIDLYRRRAKSYDASGIASLQPWRRRAVDMLNLQRGDLVVDIGCGTGLNFDLLQEAIGPTGKVIGVDLTDAMLDRARERIAQYGWKNVELVQSDAAQYEFPGEVSGVISTFALSFVPDCAGVIENGAQALAIGGKWSVLDMAWPAGWPIWWRRILFFLPLYGITADLIQRRPWQTIWQAMERSLGDVRRQRFWMGFFYLVCGTRIQ